MIINVLTELRQPVGTESQVDIVQPTAGHDGLHVKDLRGTADLLRTDRGLLVTFEGSATTDAVCSRCLTETGCEVSVSFLEEYVPVVDPLTGGRVRSGFEADAFRIAPDFTLDMWEGIRQYLLMSGSAKPLCRPNCPGLCPECGTDLNERRCGCGGAGRGGAPSTPLK